MLKKCVLTWPSFNQASAVGQYSCLQRSSWSSQWLQGAQALWLQKTKSFWFILVLETHLNTLFHRTGTVDFCPHSCHFKGFRKQSPPGQYEHDNYYRKMFFIVNISHINDQLGHHQEAPKEEGWKKFILLLTFSSPHYIVKKAQLMLSYIGHQNAQKQPWLSYMCKPFIPYMSVIF